MKILFLLLLVTACSSRSKVKNPYFYLAEKDGQTLHILGTMHVGFKLEDFHPVVNQALDNASLVFLEADEELYQKYSEAREKKYREYFVNNVHRPFPELKNKLSPVTWKHLSYTLAMDEVTKILNRIDVKVSPYELNPFLIHEITRDLIGRHQMYAFHPEVINGWRNLDVQWALFDSFNLVDKEILMRARKNKQEVMALDTLDYDIVKLMTDFEKNGLNFLEYFYGTPKAMAAEYNKVREAYREGKEIELLKEFELKGQSEVLLRDRNEAWVPRLSWRTEKRIFVAVGAAHLQGKYSILPMLEKRGYKVTKINLSE